MEARCDFGILFFCVVDVGGQHLIEVKCRSVRCGVRPGVVVMHRFTMSGTLHSTRSYRDPGVRKEKGNDNHSRSAPLRSA
jgi:hypothetical protein